MSKKKDKGKKAKKKDNGDGELVVIAVDELIDAAGEWFDSIEDKDEDELSPQELALAYAYMEFFERVSRPGRPSPKPEARSMLPRTITTSQSDKMISDVEEYLWERKR